MRAFFTVINLLLIGLLVYIIVYPEIQARKRVEASLLFEDNLTSLPVFVADELGFFDSLKVNVTIEEVEKPGDEMDLVMKGTYHVGCGTPWSSFIFKAAGRPEAYRVLFSAFSTIEEPYTALFARRKVRIRRPSDYAGKRVGYLRGGKMEPILRKYFQNKGVDPEKIVFTPLAFFEIDSALQRNLVDVLLAVEPYRSFLLHDRSVKLIEDAVIEKYAFTPLPIGVGFSSLVVLNLKKREFIRVFKALNRAIDFTREYPDSARKILLARLGLPDTLNFTIPSFQKYEEVDPLSIRRYANFLKENDVLFVDVDVEKFLLRREELK